MKHSKYHQSWPQAQIIFRSNDIQFSKRSLFFIAVKCHILYSSFAHSFSRFHLSFARFAVSALFHARCKMWIFFKCQWQSTQKLKLIWKPTHKLPWPSKVYGLQHIYSLRLNEHQNLYYIESFFMAFCIESLVASCFWNHIKSITSEERVNEREDSFSMYKHVLSLYIESMNVFSHEITQPMKMWTEWTDKTNDARMNELTEVNNNIKSIA